ncbi:MAG: glycosyltransferase [Alphaproteobacteria bacterium]|nr:glycosyltransferase [Alphaproteobacteria bacterium]
MKNNPTISVIMPTYNHAPFVEQAIQSVLDQQGADFEFLIADDGSSDRTRDVVASVQDQRIAFFPNKINRGAAIVTNELINKASGEFIALINSDDCWSDPDKLAYQEQVMRENPSVGACFGRAQFMDEGGHLIAKEGLAFGATFDQENRSRGRWLQRFFDSGNCLCHPTILIRKSCYEELGVYNNRMRQLPDFDMWIRLVKRHDIFVSDRELINFRVLPGENASCQTVSNSIRTMNEHYIIANSFFADVDRKLLLQGFRDRLRVKELPSEEHVEIEKALLYFSENRWLERPYKMVGLMAMYRLLSEEKYRKILEHDYEITDRWFHDMTADIDILRSRRDAAVLNAGRATKSVLGKIAMAFTPRKPPLRRA